MRLRLGKDTRNSPIPALTNGPGIARFDTAELADDQAFGLTVTRKGEPPVVKTSVCCTAEAGAGYPAG
jgi:hypothetical protein